MIFIPRNYKTLTSMVSKLPLRHYAAPRFEIPESIWEAFDRLDTQKVFDSLKKIGQDLHLHEVVGGEVHNRYDAPGDFQLVRREDIFKINGFDEEMLIGWHCDSNLNKRLMILNGPIGDAEPLIDAYHCDHTREITPMHSSDSPANDGNKFIYNVTETITNKKEKWGMPNLDFEEIEISDNRNNFMLENIIAGLKDYKKERTFSSYAPDSYEKNSFPEAHTITFLIDPIMALPRSTKISWVGSTGKFQKTFSKILQSQSFREIILCNQMSAKVITDSDLIIINPYKPMSDHHELNFDLLNSLFELLTTFNTNKKRKLIFDTKFFFIDFSHTRNVRAIQERFDCAKTPYSTRVVIGTVKQLTKMKTFWGVLGSNIIFKKISILREIVRQWALVNRNKHPIVFYILRRVNRFLEILQLG